MLCASTALNILLAYTLETGCVDYVVDHKDMRLIEQ